MGDAGNKSLVSPDGVALIWIVSASARVIFPCTIKFRRRFLLLAPAHPGSPGKRAVKRWCLCVIFAMGETMQFKFRIFNDDGKYLPADNKFPTKHAAIMAWSMGNSTASSNSNVTTFSIFEFHDTLPVEL